MDHDAGHIKVRFVPTVIQHVNEPASADASWYNGNVKIILKNSVFQASNAFGALLELERNCRSELRRKPIMVLHSDGGGEHNLSFPSVQAAWVAFWMRQTTYLDRIVATNSCPNRSFLNSVERIMPIINLVLYGVSLERPIIPNDFPGFCRCRSGV